MIGDIGLVPQCREKASETELKSKLSRQGSCSGLGAGILQGISHVQ